MRYSVRKREGAQVGVMGLNRRDRKELGRSWRIFKSKIWRLGLFANL